MMHTASRLAALALTALLALGACGAEPVAPPAAQLALRDILGMQPRLLDDWTDADLASVRVRALSESRNHQDGPLEGWIDPASDSEVQPLPEPWHLLPVDPLNTMRRLDEDRLRLGDEPWLAGLFEQQNAGAITTGCPLPESFFQVPPTPDALPGNWKLHGWEESDHAHLGRLADNLASWMQRCAENNGWSEPPHALRIVRQDSAPWIVAWWPQRNTLYINPILLRLLRDQESGVHRTRSAALVKAACTSSRSNLLDACNEELACICAQCTENNCPGLLTGENGWSTCQTIDQHPGGPDDARNRVCLALQTPAQTDFAACLARASDNTCAPPGSDASTASMAISRWSEFGADAASCLPFARNCMRGQNNTTSCASAAVTGENDWDRCTSRIACVCNKCTADYLEDNPNDPDCSSIYPGEAITTTCRAITQTMDSGPERFCADELLQLSRIVRCFNTGGYDTSCGLPSAPIRSSAELARAYTGFADRAVADLCATALVDCLTDDGNVPSQDTSVPDESPVTPRPEVERSCCQDCEHDCYNDSGMNETCGAMTGQDLFFVDKDRPDLNSTICKEEGLCEN